MSKNFVIFSMSPFRGNKTFKFTADNSKFIVETTHTNETALKYIDWKLKQQNQQIDDVFAFVTDEVYAKDLSKFKELFQDYNFTIHDVPLLNNGDLQGSFASISTMFNVLEKHIDHDPSDIVIHFDMTGGLRHGAMLMLALIQMLNYRGFKIGMLLYSNLDFKTFNNKIEDASKLLQMYTLIGGAKEFTSFGSVEQLKTYFEDKLDIISSPLKDLLNTMEQLSETIRVCVNFTDMSSVLFSLKQKLETYTQYLAECDNKDINEYELFFSKFITNIENEYSPILPQDDNSINLPKLIKWCAERGFLQQSIIFYTEWLPEYLTDSGLIHVDPDIREYCLKIKEDWRSWQCSFLRSYTPKQNLLPEENTAKEKALQFDPKYLKYNEVRYMVNEQIKKSRSIYTLKKKYGKKNAKFDLFLQQIIDFMQDTNEQNFVDKVLKLDKDSFIYILLYKSKPQDNEFQSFLTVRLRRCNSIPDLIIAALNSVPKNELIDMFDLADKHKSATDNSSTNTVDIQKLDKNALKQKEYFKILLDNGQILSRLSEDKLLNFVYDYNIYVKQWRNQISHANSSSTDKQQNKNIVDAIVSSVNLLNLYNK